MKSKLFSLFNVYTDLPNIPDSSYADLKKFERLIISDLNASIDRSSKSNVETYEEIDAYIRLLPYFPEVAFTYDVSNYPKVFLAWAKELIANSFQHSNCTKISIKLFVVPGFHILRFSDNGTSSKTKSEVGVGMKNIYEAIRQLNGSIEIKQESGYYVEIHLPH